LPFKRIEHLLASESTEQVEENVEGVQGVLSEFLTVEEAHHREGDEWQSECLEEATQVHSEGEHHNDGRADILSSPDHTQEVEGELAHDEREH